jgi:MYXO-CTERM domain-containing protein
VEETIVMKRLIALASLGFAAPAAAQIIGGTPDPDHANVVYLTLGGGACSGTLVAPRVVLTAAHCTAGVTSANVMFGASISDPERVTIGSSMVMTHRYYDSATIGIGLPYDIAMIRLRDPAPAGVTPMAMNFDPLDDSLVGDNLLAVGFGNTNGAAGTGGGTRRRALLPINEISGRLIGMGNDLVNTCQGDSGGPGIYTFDGVENVIGITSTGPVGCVGNSHMTRVDVYDTDFIIPILDAWDGPCQHDFTCVTDGCRTPDPDCDPCQVDAFCAPGCAQLDLDCPLAGFSGEPCENNDDCESRYCVAAHDDPRIHYCSDPCDPAQPVGEQCESPLSVCAAFNGDDPSCHYGDTTPGAQGYPCQDGADCRSGVCDPDDAICIEQCGDGLPECPAGYECASVGGDVSACRLPSDGCGCRGARNRNDLGALVLLAVVIVFARRRRARGQLS